MAAWWWLSQFLQSSVCYTWQATSIGVSFYYYGSQESGGIPGEKWNGFVGLCLMDEILAYMGLFGKVLT